MQYNEVFAKVVSHSKEHGFIFQSSEIYDGLGAVYDYGPLGVLLKNHLKELWWKAMVQMHDNIVGLDSAILMHPTVWKASGHVDAFNDPLIDNKDSKKRYRADNLVEDEIQRQREKAQKEADKKAKKEGWVLSPADYLRSGTRKLFGQELLADKVTGLADLGISDTDFALFRTAVLRFLAIDSPTDNQDEEILRLWGDCKFSITADRLKYNLFLKNSRYGAKAEELEQKLAAVLASGDLQQLGGLIEEAEIACPVSGTRNWTDVRQFNLMFKTQLGTVEGSSGDLYLRPETAQGIFVNFLNVQKSQRLKPPFGIAQIGKAFRNEIVARQFIFRMREFEQMEMQYFVPPGSQPEYYQYWKEKRMAWHRALGLPADRLRYHDHDSLAHYADAAVDIEFHFPFGFKELEGIHSRTNFDLSRHEEFSKKKLQFFDTDSKENYVPYVVETSVGLDRSVLVHLCNAYREEEAPTGEGGTDVRTVLALHPLLAPVKVAVFPLVKKDGMPEVAQQIVRELQLEMQVTYDEKDTVGRRYRRQDAKGTPFCVTIDSDTLTDDTVTIRERDSMQQHRIPRAGLRTWLLERLSPSALLGGL